MRVSEIKLFLIVFFLPMAIFGQIALDPLDQFLFKSQVPSVMEFDSVTYAFDSLRTTPPDYASAFKREPIFGAITNLRKYYQGDFYLEFIGSTTSSLHTIYAISRMSSSYGDTVDITETYYDLQGRDSLWIPYMRNGAAFEAESRIFAAYQGAVLDRMYHAPATHAFDTVSIVEYYHSGSFLDSVRQYMTPNQSSAVIVDVYSYTGTRNDSVEFFAIDGSGTRVKNSKFIFMHNGAGEVSGVDVYYKLPAGMTFINRLEFFQKTIGLAEAPSRRDKCLVSIYPNPSNGKFRVSAESEEFQFQVLNLAGLEQAKGILGSESTLNLEELAAGSYVLRFFSPDCGWQQKLITKQ